jgi:hypothetical protein
VRYSGRQKRFRNLACPRSGGEPARSAGFGSAEFGDEDPDAADWPLFQKYPRIARDLARQLGKDVELVLVGEETEVDKTMIEDLADPLIHLIRNAVDHGVEMPEERQAAGKPTKSIGAARGASGGRSHRSDHRR